MAQVLDAFINRPGQTVEELDLELADKLATSSSSTEDLTKLHDSNPGTPRSIGLSESSRTSSDNSLSTPENDPAGQSPYDKTLLTLWSALLNLPENSITGDASFFDLGGDSITAMKLAGEARDCGVPLTVADVFRNPSFEAMSARVRAAASMHALDRKLSKHQTQATETQTPDGDLYERFSLLAATNVDAFLQTRIVPQVCVFRGGISDVLPATDFQSLAVAGALLESRWMLNHFYLDGDGPLSLVHLKRACFRLVQALDILRTVFVPSRGRFLQVVLRNLRPAFHVLETDEPLDDFKVGQEATEPRLGESFVEFTVVKHRSSSRHRIFLRISHAQYDGVCFPKVLGALQAAYHGETVPRPPSFANYLRAAAGELTSEHYQHWKRLLAGSSMTELVRRAGPNYHQNAAGSTTTCLRKTIELPPVESGHITSATVVKAAWAYVLAQISASADVVFGHTISGRNAAVEGVGNMVGPCLNMVPVRVQFASGPGWTARHLLRQVQDQQIANMSHEVLGFREIIRHCTSWPHWTYFASTVQHQNIDQGGQIRLGDVDYTVGCASSAQEDFADLSVLSQPLPDDDQYEIILSFAEGGPIPRDFAERALEMLCEAAQLFATNPDTALPSADELSSKPQLVPFDEAPSSPNASDDKGLQAAARLQHLGHLGHDQQSELASLVSTSWREVLSNQEQQQSTTGAGTTEPIDMDTSFFELGGDIIGLSQLAWLLDQRGFSAPRLEDLVENPTVRGHVALLAEGIPAAPGSPASEPDQTVQRAATFPSVAVQKLTRVDSGLKLAKAFGMVKKKLTVGGKKKGVSVVAVA
jgi:aryl carrier-like protein